MGLTIHYTIRLRDMARLPELVEEVEDICKSLKWGYDHYWETMDKAVLHKRFEIYNGLVNMVANVLENAEWTVTDNPHQIAAQLEDILKKRIKSDE